MIIQRDGNEYELTTSELCDAYHETQKMFDIEDILEMLKYDGDFPEIIQEFSNPVFADAVAKRYRKYLWDCESSEEHWDCMMDAYDYVKRNEK